MLYMVTFAINTPPMLAYIPHMDPMGDETLVNMMGFLLPTFPTCPEGVPLVVPRGHDRHPRALGSTTLKRKIDGWRVGKWG